VGRFRSVSARDWEATTAVASLLLSSPPAGRVAGLASSGGRILNMRAIAIQRVDLDSQNRLGVYPSDGDYSFIWRDASSVRWDAAAKRLFVLPVDGFSNTDEFLQIIKAVKNEYGIILVMDDSTLFDVPDALAHELRGSVR
jgi:hypothetical protein